MTIIDPDTASAYQRAEQLAVRLGRPLIDVLHDTGLLMTPLRERDISLLAIKELITRLESNTPSDLMVKIWGRPEGTPNDMYHAIMQFMEMWYREFSRVHHGTEGSTR